MTRFLSESLEAREPSFRLGLRRLEAAHGNPNIDIRFSTQLQQAAKDKMRALGLNPDDTTPEELYHFLQERMKADDARLTKHLRTLAATHVSAEAEVVSGMVHALRQLPGSREGFALKNSSLRTILRKLPPKKAMRQLGYRSMDSFLKHEPPVSVLAAAWLSEGAAWHHRLLDQYKQLRPTDFENRAIDVVSPTSRRWHDLASNTVSQAKHNVLSFKETGTLMLLPLPADTPPGATTAALSLALHELNQLRAAATFLKLCQVRPDFGELVRTVAKEELGTSARLLDQPVSWQLIQRYYARQADHFREEVFEPHIRWEDMAWEPIEHTLSAIDPAFEFWKGSAHLGVLHDRRPVSFNVVDVALGCCNKLPFEQRITQFFRQSLWQELLLRYVDPRMIEQTVTASLQPALAVETAPA